MRIYVLNHNLYSLAVSDAMQQLVLSAGLAWCAAQVTAGTHTCTRPLRLYTFIF